MDTAKLKEEALALRREKHQMIKTDLNAAVESNHDLAIVYTPGVSAPCLAIKDDEDLSLELTWRGNVVAVISDGTRVLGMGDIGAAAAMPVMEGKSALYKRFGQIAAIPITLDTKDPQEFIHTVKLLEKNFAGINLEDVRIEHTVGRQTAIAHLYVVPDLAVELRVALASAGWLVLA